MVLRPQDMQWMMQRSARMAGMGAGAGIRTIGEQTFGQVSSPKLSSLGEGLEMKIEYVCSLAGCLAIGFFIGYMTYPRPPKLDENDIAFPTKVYADTGDFVYITGRLAGTGLAYKNNVQTITCYRERGECELQSIQQIGPHQISSLHPVTTLPITHWDDALITASDPQVVNQAVCIRLTINIERKREFALWVEQPTNQAAVSCQHADTKTNKWTIESALWERKALANP